MCEEVGGPRFSGRDPGALVARISEARRRRNLPRLPCEESGWSVGSRPDRPLDLLVAPPAVRVSRFWRNPAAGGAVVALHREPRAPPDRSPVPQPGAGVRPPREGSAGCWPESAHAAPRDKWGQHAGDSAREAASLAGGPHWLRRRKGGS